MRKTVMGFRDPSSEYIFAYQFILQLALKEIYMNRGCLKMGSLYFSNTINQF
jgi:hypothetical protein